MIYVTDVMLTTIYLSFLSDLLTPWTRNLFSMDPQYRCPERQCM